MIDREISVVHELQGLLVKACELSDENGLSRLRDLLTYLSEGADLVEFRCDVPEGLEHNPVLRRMLATERLLTDLPMGRA
ncbi:hypothetical protein [Arenibaculum pallidiluteum]|uniref:hypothetical protein n=1 Tax=Arenibaculum pallidiluteum TaxID=2812559 RepID=UPI001A961105|nr:hypothetical protein [Arenibaculum pallidiluteum]